MSRATGLASLLALILAVSDLHARILPPAIDNLARMNHRLHGTVIDHTHHHGADRRFWSDALCQKRDMYVYLPRNKQYRYALAAGFMRDETTSSTRL